MNLLNAPVPIYEPPERQLSIESKKVAVFGDRFSDHLVDFAQLFWMTFGVSYIPRTSKLIVFQSHVT